jgi:hypothetical protein
MWRGDGLGLGQVGDGTGELEDAVEGAGRELSLRSPLDTAPPLIVGDGIEDALSFAIDAEELLTRVFEAFPVVAASE